MRRLLNILAVLVGMLGLVLVLMNAALCVWAVVYYKTSGATLPSDLPLLAVIGLGAALCLIGGLIASRALKHLRKPNARSAGEVLTLAIYLLAFSAISPLIKSMPSVVILLLIVSLFFVRRYVLQHTARVSYFLKQNASRLATLGRSENASSSMRSLHRMKLFGLPTCSTMKNSGISF